MICQAVIDKIKFSKFNFPKSDYVLVCEKPNVNIVCSKVWYFSYLKKELPKSVVILF